jgi:hypothetical protein
VTTHVRLGCVAAAFSLAVFPIAGCTSIDISKVGPDTYMASSRASAFRGGADAAQSKAIAAAGEYCAGLGREVLVQNYASSGIPGGGRGQVVFRCLSASDPEYQRPNYQATPNVVIENRK